MRCDHLREIAALKDRIEDLEAEIAEMKAALARDAENIFRAFDVTVYQARTLAMLATGRIMTRDSLARVCLKGDGENVRNVDWQIKRIRMRNTGLTIKTVYNAGYCLEGESLKMVRAAINEGVNECERHLKAATSSRNGKDASSRHTRTASAFGLSATA